MKKVTMLMVELSNPSCDHGRMQLVTTAQHVAELVQSVNAFDQIVCAAGRVVKRIKLVGNVAFAFDRETEEVRRLPVLVAAKEHPQK